MVNTTVSPTEFLRALDNVIQKQVLLSGYLAIRFLQLDMESLGFDKNIATFLEQCSEEEYYHFFPPLSPRHPHPYHKKSASDTPSSDLTHIDIRLFSLENLTEGENSVRAGFSICASWEPVQEEIR